MSAVPRRIVVGSYGLRLKEPKYRNKPTQVGGIKFDSKREAERFKQLKLLESAGRVKNIKLQETYNLVFGGTILCKYRADFVYEEYEGGQWTSVVEDVKGVRTAVYRLKKKLMKALYGITIRET